jgi:hypothetical protein
MALKGIILPDHIPVNKYELTIVGMSTIVMTSVSGLETEVPAIDLPDRTKATGGQPSSAELTVTVPMHHASEILQMDIWHTEAQDPITITYKRAGILEHKSGTGDIIKQYTLIGIWCSKRKLPDLAYDDDGAMAEVEYTLQVDSVMPL